MLLKLIDQSTAGLLSKSLWEQNVFLFFAWGQHCRKKEPTR